MRRRRVAVTPVQGEGGRLEGGGSMRYGIVKALAVISEGACPGCGRGLGGEMDLGENRDSFYEMYREKREKRGSGVRGSQTADGQPDR